MDHWNRREPLINQPSEGVQPTAAELARRYAAGLADPREVTEETLARIAQHPDRAFFLALTPERARAEAEASAARYRTGQPLGPLDGVPIAWKDLIDMAGAVTTAGSALRRGAAPAAQDAEIVARLARAGMVSVGKTNLTEFAYSGIGLNPHFGTPRNPHDPIVARAPGGSSSGSAVAVAAGLVPVAMGSDTGGSVRVPAAFNGIVGFKTSEGRIPKHGVFPLSETLDTIGPLALSVEDCVLVDAAMRGIAAPAATPAALAGLRLVAPTNAVLEGAEPELASRFEAALAALEEVGAAVERRPVPILDEVSAVLARHGSLVAAEALQVHQSWFGGPDAARVDPRVVARIALGARMSALDLLEIQAARRRLKTAIAEEIGEAFLAMPTVVHVAPEIAPLEADPDLFHQVNLRTLRNTMLGNFLDLPGLSLPAGRDGSGLPFGFLLSAPAGADDRLLAAGLAVEPLLRKAFT